MRNTILAALLLISGCGTAFQGFKMRAQSPSIDEGFRKLALAVTTDGYETGMINLSDYSLTTQWRGLKADELAKHPDPEGVSRTEYRLSVRMEPRGKLYDVFLNPSIRYTMQNGTTTEMIAPAHHPLMEKWERVLRQLLELEQRDED